jgi:carboxypeptidase family protein
MRTTAVIALAIAALVLAAPSSALAQGGIGMLAGCVNAEHSPIPGVTIKVTGPDVQRTVTTGEDGCFRVTELPSATYRLLATVPGFVAVTRDPLVVRSGELIRADFGMTASAICECIARHATIPQLWKDAAVVAHVRISGHDYGPVEPVSASVTHTATLLRVWKDARNASEARNSVRFVQSPGEHPLEAWAVGQEFIVFVTPNGDGPLMLDGALVLQDGLYRPALFDDYWRKVDDLLAEIAAVSGQ